MDPIWFDRDRSSRLVSFRFGLRSITLDDNRRLNHPSRRLPFPIRSEVVFECELKDTLTEFRIRKSAVGIAYLRGEGAVIGSLQLNSDGVRTAEAGEWVIEPVEALSAELESVALIEVEGFIDADIGIEERGATQIGSLTKTLRANGRRTEAVHIKLLILLQPRGGVAGEDWKHGLHRRSEVG